MISSTMLISQNWHDNRVIAHRGVWKEGSLPQNSIASMAATFKGGYHASEFDVRMTSDDELVVIHDPSHAGFEIEKITYDDLKKHTLANGEVIPTLKTYLKTGTKQKKSRLILEIKISPAGRERSLIMADKTVEMVKKFKAQKWITYISFDKDILLQILKNDPKADTQYLSGDLSPAQLKDLGITGMDYHYTVFQKYPNWIDECRKLGIKTNVWTVNDEPTMRYFLLLGVDHVTTDEPKLALATANDIGTKKRELAWSDEFMYDGLPDPSIWTYDVGGHGWGNQELQFYTNADTNNVKVSNGTLKITARKMQYEDKDYTSTRLVTKGLKDIFHGRVDVRAKIAQGRGAWPAIWTLGQNIKEVGWPACGEIDIMEHVGFDADTIHASTHSIEHNHIKRTQKTNQIKIKDPYNSFHVYSVEYSPEKMTFLLDDKSYYTILRSECKDWPFDQPQYLLLNVAVGGFWGAAQGIDDSIWPQTMEVDYVRVWK